MTTKRSLYLFVQILSALALNEPMTDNIAVQPLSQACLARQTNNAADGTCYSWNGTPTDGPSPFPCPCIDNDKAGGAFPGTGKVETPINNANNFVDYTIGKNRPKKYNSLTGYSFTDNTNEIFVLAKAGVVFHVDVDTEIVTEIYDFSDQVHNVGDYGGLSIETHTNFIDNPYVYVSYVNAALVGTPREVNVISYVRVMRLVISNRQMASKSFIIGQDPLDSNALCSSSHAGGALAMGHDGSLFITLGDGSHFDTDTFDFGQVQERYPHSQACRDTFGTRAMGSMTAQSKDTIAGKLIRVDPATGNGICQASQGFSTLNPYCSPNIQLRDSRARIYAMGFRNPFSMNMRPRSDDDAADGPGVPYVGDVGLGSYEEINAITRPGLNLGWPCWEGPQTMAGYRDSPFQRLSLQGINRAKADDGTAMNCAYVYDNVVTEHPTYYWSRYTHQMPGLYSEQYVLGQGFTGNCVSGVAFYTGDSYPESFHNQVFFSDYGAHWIKSITVQNDKKVDQYAFKPISVPLVDLETNPRNGDLCYMEILAGTIHCLSYEGGDRPPALYIASNVTEGATPLFVGFSADGSHDRKESMVTYTAWDFGDGTPLVVDPNPTHTFSKDGSYLVTCYLSNGRFTVSSTLNITAGREAPQALITLPVSGSIDSLSFYQYDPSQEDAAITFNGAAVGGKAPFTYFWDVYMVHTNHYHPQSFTATGQSITATLSEMGAQSHVGERINFLVILIVTDADGQQSRTYTRLSSQGWKSEAPVPSFFTEGTYSSGQFILFDASATVDVELDTVTFLWDFGDGNKIEFDPSTNNKFVYHAYSAPGTYNVVLTTVDNWGSSATTTQRVTITAGYVQNVPAIPIETAVRSTALPATSSTTSPSSSTTSADSSSTSTTAIGTDSSSTSTTSATTGQDNSATREISTVGPTEVTPTQERDQSASSILSVSIALTAILFFLA